MNIAVSVFEHSLCAICGYGLNIAVSEFGRLIFRPLKAEPADPDFKDKVKLLEHTIHAVREEISYRFLLEKVVLPCISPQFANFSMKRTGVSSLIFASNHLRNNPYSQEVVAYQFSHTLILGVITSLAQQRIGLVGAVLVHVGYNLHGWQYMNGQDTAGTLKVVQYLQRCKIDFSGIRDDFVNGLIFDFCSPLVLAYEAIDWGLGRLFPQSTKVEASDRA